MGNTPSMCLDLVLRNTTDTIFTTNQVKVEIGLKFDDKIEYIPLGIFNISDVKKDDFTTRFTCYDNMFKFDTAYFSKLGDTPTLTQVVNELASITGIQFIGSLPSYTVKKLEGFTCREILSYVASLCGGNAIITRDGKFTIIYPTDVNRDVGEGVFDLKRDEVKYKIGKITCQIKEKETISKGSLGTDSMELQFENPWVTDSILTNIYNRLNGFSYLGYTMKWQGDLSLDVGDIITYIDAKGVNRKLPILNRKLSYDGGLDSELSAKGETKNSNSFNSNGSMKNKVDRVVTEVALINEAFINYAKINDADITNLKAETAKIHNLEAETANINTLLAGNIGSGSVQTIHLTGKNVVIDNAVIKDGMIDTVNANKINTGTLDTNKVTVQGPSGNLLIKDNTIQIKDSTRVRVQIGKDASGDYSMYVWDKQGNIMFDALGLKSSAIKDKIIRDDMVSDNANINGSKLNISSLITEVNKDNTQTLKASKIAFDSTGQSLEVSFNSLKSNVDNMEIGGRNLLRNSSLEEITFPYTSTEYNWRTASVNPSSTVLRTRELIKDCPAFPQGIYGIKFVNSTTTDLNVDIAQDGRVMEHGETYTISAYFKLTKGTPNFALQYGITPFFGKAFESSQTWIKHSFTFVYDKTKFSNKLQTNIYFGIRGNSFEGYACGFKLEKGSKATDWTPAIEDTDKKIESNTTAIGVVQGKIEGLIKESSITKGDVTTLKDNYTSIKATVDGINTTVASHTTSITNAQNTADSKAKVFTNTPTTPYKVGDIWTSGPSGDIMKCKVARASGNYVASDWEKASKYTDDTTANAIGMRVTTAESSIKQLNNQIALKVEATEVNNIVNNAVNNVQVGGRNLLPETDGVFSSNNYHGNSTITRGQSDPFGGTKAILLTGTSATDSFFRYIYTKILFKQEGNYTLSVWLKANKVGNFQISLNGKSVYKICNLTTEWQKFELTTNIRIINSVNHFVLGGFSSWTDTSFQVYVALPMLEEGTKASSWSPANEDIDGAISSIDSRLKTAELAITKDAIISTVQSTINTAKSEAINSANSSTDNKLKNYSTTTAMNTAITQSASDITSAVSNAYATKTALGETTTRVESVESKLTATSLTTTISTAINSGTSSISTTQFVMDKTGFTIKNGAIKIQNKAGTNVLTGDSSGNLTLTGTLVNKSSSGVDAIKIQGTNIYFYDWERSARELGLIYSSQLTNYPNCRGFSIGHHNQGYMNLTYRKTDGTYLPYITFDKYNINPYYEAPIRILESAVFSQAVNMQNRVYIPNMIVFDSVYSNTSAKMFKAPTANRLVLEVSVNAVGDGLRIQSNTGSLLAQIRAGEHYPIHLNNNTYISGDLAVSGSKNSLQATKSYGERLINAIESAEYYYSDFGFGEINNDGECYISIDDILQECVNLDCEYHIFTQKYNGDITSIDRHRDYFIVYGEPETKFSWQYIAKRIGYENVRLDVPEIGTVEDIPVFTEEDLEVKTVEDTLLDVLNFKLEDILMEE